jgi:hypothetical protein
MPSIYPRTHSPAPTRCSSISGLRTPCLCVSFKCILLHCTSLHHTRAAGCQDNAPGLSGFFDKEVDAPISQPGYEGLAHGHSRCQDAASWLARLVKLFSLGGQADSSLQSHEGCAPVAVIVLTTNKCKHLLWRSPGCFLRLPHHNMVPRRILHLVLLWACGTTIDNSAFISTNVVDYHW